MTSFLPDTYKEVPKSPSNYMKLIEGENLIRVLSSAIVGFEYWNTENKPVRSQEPFSEMPVDIKTDKGGNKTIKHFWAFVVLDYSDSRIKILEITQKSIMRDIKALVDNKRWGNPQGYDISITRTGEGMETEYATMPNPHTPLDLEIASAFANIKIDLTALYRGEDPFAATNANSAPNTPISEPQPSQGVDTSGIEAGLEEVFPDEPPTPAELMRQGFEGYGELPV